MRCKGCFSLVGYTYTIKLLNAFPGALRGICRHVRKSVYKSEVSLTGSQKITEIKMIL